VFDTGINLWLQATGSEAATALLSGVTLLGYLPTYALLLVSLAFGVRLRPALAVLGAVLLTGIATNGVKEILALPRPDQIDDRLMRTPASRGEALVPRGGAPGFWSLPGREAIETVRASGRGNYGFPSGHVSASAAFLIGAAWFFRARWLYGATALFVPLMALSRMYLGRHFLADVLGGLFLGLGVTAAWIRLLPNPEALAAPQASARALTKLWATSLVLAALTPFLPSLDPAYVGALLGFAVSCAALRHQPPRDGGSSGERLTRVALGLVVFTMSLGGTVGVASWVGATGALPQLAVGAVVTASTFAGTALLCLRLGLYTQDTASA